MDRERDRERDRMKERWVYKIMSQLYIKFLYLHIKKLHDDRKCIISNYQKLHEESFTYWKELKRIVLGW